MTSRALLRLLALAALVLAASASTYTLRWGDTLSHVASRFGVPVADLAAANGIADPDQVVAGRRLTVPGGGGDGGGVAVSGGTYTVAAGDNLTSIALRHGTTVRGLQAINQLADPDFLREGQQLRLPGGGAGPSVAGAVPIRALTAMPRCPVAGAGPWDTSNSFSAPRPGGFQHEGNDIFARAGTPVVAPVSGVIRLVQGVRAGNAFYLTGGDGTVYYGAHLHAYSVGAGPVAEGQQIGLVGNTGDAAATPPHLHFEIKPGGGAPIDPHHVLRTSCRG